MPEYCHRLRHDLGYVASWTKKRLLAAAGFSDHSLFGLASNDSVRQAATRNSVEDIPGPHIPNTNGPSGPHGSVTPDSFITWHEREAEVREI